MTKSQKNDLRIGGSSKNVNILIQYLKFRDRLEMRNTGDVNHSYGGKEFADLDGRIRHLTTVAQKTRYLEEYTDIIEPTFLRAALTTARH